MRESVCLLQRSLGETGTQAEVRKSRRVSKFKLRFEESKNKGETAEELAEAEAGEGHRGQVRGESSQQAGKFRHF